MKHVIVVSILPFLGLTQCHPSAVQRQEMRSSKLLDPANGRKDREKRESREERETQRIARKHGLSGPDQSLFENAARAAANTPSPSCLDELGAICSYNNVVRCRTVAEHHAPKSVGKLVELIERAAAEGRRIRPTGAQHTANEAICPDGMNPLTVSLEHFRDFELDPEGETVRVGAGLLMEELMELLLAEGFTLGVAVPFFRGVTVGGALATAAHGSSWTQSSVISSNAVALTLVDGRGREHSLNLESDETLWTASLASMGAFGITTSVTFRVSRSPRARFSSGASHDRFLLSASKARAETSSVLESLFGGHAWGNVAWFPNADRYLWTRVLADEVHGIDLEFNRSARTYENAMLRPYVTASGIRIANRVLGGMTAKRGNCWLERVGLRRFGRGVLAKYDAPDSRRRKRRGSGPLSRLVTSAVLPEQAQIPQVDFEFAFPAERAEEVLTLAKEKLDGDNLCLPLIGVFLRFSLEPSVPTTLIGHSATRSTAHDPTKPARVMFFEFVVYAPERERARRATSDYFAGYDAFAGELLSIGGWPHWAKNNVDLIRDHVSHDPVYSERLGRFRVLADCLDPAGVFSSQFAEEVGLRMPADRRDRTACTEL